MKNITLVLPALAALALLAPAGCRPNTASMQRHVEERLRLPDDHLKDDKQLGLNYKQTGDPHYATPQHRMTMLHLAAQAHHLALVKALLADGADPNALMLPLTEGGLHETPLTFTMADILRGRDPGPMESLAIIETLLEAGADITPTAQPCTNVLAAAHRLHTHDGDARLSGEELVLKLIEKGAKGGLPEAQAFVSSQWVQALTRVLPMLSEEERAALRQQESVWHVIAAPFTYDRHTQVDDEDEWKARAMRDREHIACAAALLQGSQPGGAASAAMQKTLRAVAEGLVLDEAAAQEFDRVDTADFIALLLQCGADAYAPVGGHGIFVDRDSREGKACVADCLAADHEVCKVLMKIGVMPEPPAHVLAADTLVPQLLDIPAAAFREEEVAQQAGLLQQLIAAPTVAQLADADDQRRACAKALALLGRGDKDAAAAFIAALPAWSDPAAWAGDATEARGMLYALQEDKLALQPPATELVAHARAMLAAGCPAVAHAFLGLLAHDKAAAPLIAELAKEGTEPALRAAALSCQLRAEGLPTLAEIADFFPHNRLPRDKEVLVAVMAGSSAGWRGFEDFQRLRTPERLFFTDYGRKDGDDMAEPYAAALRKLGAPAAADFVAEGKGDADAASLELETAYSLYVLAREAKFREPETEHNESKRRFPSHSYSSFLSL